MVIQKIFPERDCEWCGATFRPTAAVGRFCNRSCSAKWRMRQPEHVAKVHNPIVAAKRGKSLSAWYRGGSDGAKRQLARIAALNPSLDPLVCAKISKTLRAMGHGPSVRGGNGRGMTKQQEIMLHVLGAGWVAEYAQSLGPKMPGYPTNYKIDLANVPLKIGVEVDGFSHGSRRHLDVKKDAKLAELGWTILRFTNKEIQTWRDLGKPKGARIPTILAQHGISI